MSSILLSVLTISAALVNKFINGVSLIQSPLLLLSALLFIVGVQLVMMGLLAEIGVRTYHELQAKPTYVVRRVIRNSK